MATQGWQLGPPLREKGNYVCDCSDRAAEQANIILTVNGPTRSCFVSFSAPAQPYQPDLPTNSHQKEMQLEYS